MKVLALDISLSTGWCLLEGEVGAKPKILDQGLIALPCGLKELGDYPWNYLAGAKCVIAKLIELIERKSIEGFDQIIVEETNRGCQRYSQKILEYLHCLLVEYLSTNWYPAQVHYVNTSDWRRVLGIHLTRVDKAKNSKVRRLKRIGSEQAKASLKEEGLRGKITKKHLAIRWANETYNLSLRPKDDDLADALALGTAAFLGVSYCDGTNQKRGKQ